MDDFNSLYIYQSPEFFYFPTGVTDKFRNIIVLVVAHTGLRSLTEADMKPFTSLKGLYIDYSKITSISADLFAYNVNLEELSLQYNNIQHVEFNSFKSLIALKSFSFDGNDCYDGNSKQQDITNLIKSIELHCSPQEVFIPDNESTSNHYESSTEDTVMSSSNRFEVSLKVICSTFLISIFRYRL